MPHLTITDVAARDGILFVATITSQTAKADTAGDVRHSERASLALVALGSFEHVRVTYGDIVFHGLGTRRSSAVIVYRKGAPVFAARALAALVVGLDARALKAARKSA